MGKVLTALASESLIASCGMLREADDAEITDADRLVFRDAQERARRIRLDVQTNRVPDEWEELAQAAALAGLHRQPRHCAGRLHAGIGAAGSAAADGPCYRCPTGGARAAVGGEPGGGGTHRPRAVAAVLAGTAQRRGLRATAGRAGRHGGAGATQQHGDSDRGAVAGGRAAGGWISCATTINRVAAQQHHPLPYHRSPPQEGSIMTTTYAAAPAVGVFAALAERTP